MKTVFDIAQARLKAVQEMDGIIARQREQKAELEALRAQQEAILRNGTSDLNAAMLKYEGELILLALKSANKSVTNAAKLLGISYQYLAFTIEARHPELILERSPIVRRKRA